MRELKQFLNGNTILASASPRRKEILSSLISNFEIIKPNFDESSISEEKPAKLVQILAEKKAERVAFEHKIDNVIIAADTVIDLKGAVLGKPESNVAAITMLKSLAGRRHRVLTGVCVFFKQVKAFGFVESTEVRFSDMPEADIAAYAKTGLPLDRAGAYGIQDAFGQLYIEGIQGDYLNAVGFPLNRFVKEMNKFFKDQLL